MSVHTLLVKFSSSPEKAKALEASLLRMAVESKKEVGCLNYDLHQSTETPGDFMIYESWENKSAHSMHDQSLHVKEWRERKHEFLDAATVVTVWKHVE